jgi:AmmeMemoRadiSam system protein B
MIVYTAFVPHTPLVFESVGKERSLELDKTKAALLQLRDELRVAHPDVVIVISSHAGEQTEVFSLNMHEEYRAELKEFGDYETAEVYKPATALIDQIQRELRAKDMHITLHSQESLTHGAAIPLLFLEPDAKMVKVISIATCQKSPKEHVQFGNALRDCFDEHPARIAVVASGDLAHTLSKEAPLGYKKEGKLFDEAVQYAVNEFSLSTLLSLDEKVVHNAAECGYLPLLVLFGVLDDMEVIPKTLSYQHPFGVGYLTARFY